MDKIKIYLKKDEDFFEKEVLIENSIDFFKEVYAIFLTNQNFNYFIEVIGVLENKRFSDEVGNLPFLKIYKNSRGVISFDMTNHDYFYNNKALMDFIYKRFNVEYINYKGCCA